MEAMGRIRMNNYPVLRPSCVITGGTGYIGSCLARFLCREGWDVHIVTRPNSSRDYCEDFLGKANFFVYDSDVKSLISYFQNVRPDVVFHLASAVIPSHLPMDIPSLMKGNIQFGTEILEAMKHGSVPLIISTGTWWQNFDGDAYNPVDLYAATKEAFEKILRYYTECEGIRAITLRLYDVYGCGDRRPKLLNTIKSVADTGQLLNLSNGEQLLDMVYIADVCAAYQDAYKLLLENKDIQNEVFSVCTHDLRSLREIVSLFTALLDGLVLINWGGKPYKKREIMIPSYPFPTLPGWVPKISLEDGLRMLSSWKTNSLSVYQPITDANDC